MPYQDGIKMSTDASYRMVQNPALHALPSHPYDPCTPSEKHFHDRPGNRWQDFPSFLGFAQPPVPGMAADLLARRAGRGQCGRPHGSGQPGQIPLRQGGAVVLLHPPHLRRHPLGGSTHHRVDIAVRHVLRPHAGLVLDLAAPRAVRLSAALHLRGAAHVLFSQARCTRTPSSPWLLARCCSSSGCCAASASTVGHPWP